MHRATSKFLCHYSHSYAPATSETSAEYKNIACLGNVFVQSLVLLLGRTCFYEKMSLRNRRL